MKPYQIGKYKFNQHGACVGGADKLYSLKMYTFSFELKGYKTKNGYRFHYEAWISGDESGCFVSAGQGLEKFRSQKAAKKDGILYAIELFSSRRVQSIVFSDKIKKFTDQLLSDLNSIK